MKAIKFLVVAVLASFAVEASAQLKKDLTEWTRIELSFDAQKFKEESWDYDSKTTLEPKGASFAIMKGISLTDKLPIFLDLGGRLSWTHQKLEWHEEDWYEGELINEVDKFTFMNIAVPVNAAYKIAFESTPNVTIVPFFGLNFKFNFFAREKFESDGLESYEKKYNLLKEEEGDAKIFQFGLNLGVGVNLRSFYVGYNFQPDLSPFMKDGSDKLKTLQNYITVGINI